MGSNLVTWFNQTIYKASATGRDADGDKTYGTPVAVKARVEKERKLLVNSQGNEIQADYMIFTTTEIVLSDSIWLPGQDPATDESKRPIEVWSTTRKTPNEVLYEVFL